MPLSVLSDFSFAFGMVNSIADIGESSKIPDGGEDDGVIVTVDNVSGDLWTGVLITVFLEDIEHHMHYWLPPRHLITGHLSI